MPLKNVNNFLSPHELERYSRHILVPSFGVLGQISLKKARILVIGAGGLGAALLQQLASCGVGLLGIMDHDHIALHNLPRQILYQEEDIGRLKAVCARKSLQKISSSLSIEIYPFKASAKNLPLLLPEYDLICDCTDNGSIRGVISDHCLRAQKNLISGAVQGLSGQFISFYYHKNKNSSPCYRCLYPEIDTTPLLNCSAQGKISLTGVLSPAVTLIANFMALEILQHFARNQVSPEETLLTLWDGLSHKMMRLSVPYSSQCKAPHPHKEAHFSSSQP